MQDQNLFADYNHILSILDTGRCTEAMWMDGLWMDEHMKIFGKSDDWREYPYLKYFNSGL